jgi:transposase
MVEPEVEIGGSVSVPRRRRSALERRRIVEETLELGASVARVALRHGVNANQVFQWRRLYREGRLDAGCGIEMKLLPVSIAEEALLPSREDIQAELPATGAIHIELPGRAVISLEGDVDTALTCAVLDCLRR